MPARRCLRNPRNPHGRDPRIVGVIDLLDQQVVHAVAGNRHAYSPIVSRLTRSSRPADVVAALVDQLGLSQIYVADLGALEGAEPDWASLETLAAAGVGLILDCGIGTVAQAQTLATFVARWSVPVELVIPLESLTHGRTLSPMVVSIGPELAVFSLDLRAGQPLARDPAWQCCRPLEIADRAWQAGARKIIALDLASVGTGKGPSVTQLCRELVAARPWTTLWAGGGVRSWADVQALTTAGCDGVLVASALHDGTFVLPPELPKRRSS